MVSRSPLLRAALGLLLMFGGVAATFIALADEESVTPPAPESEVIASPTLMPTLTPSPTPTEVILPTMEPPTIEPPTIEPPTMEPPTIEPPTIEPPTVEPPTIEPPTVEPPTVEPPTIEPPTIEPPTIEPPTIEPPAVDSMPMAPAAEVTAEAIAPMVEMLPTVEAPPAEVIVPTVEILPTVEALPTIEAPPAEEIVPTIESELTLTVEPETVAQQPIAAQVSGAVLLAGVPVSTTVTLTGPDGALYSAVVAADGAFDLPDIAPGDYLLEAGAVGHLSRQMQVTLVEGQTLTLPPVNLPAGDTNADERIDLNDAALVAANFNGPALVPQADLNGDGWIDVRDLAVIGAQLGLAGPLPWLDE